MRLAIYMRRISKGVIDPVGALKIDRQRAGTLAVDAGNGLGQVQASKVLDRLIPMARECGIAAATIRNSQHFGTLSYYCNRAAEAGMILIATTTGEPAMSPEGGSEAFFGTNPIAASFPTGKGFAVKIDLATSLVARGNIIAAQKKGEKIPEGWALDPAGNPTTDASQALLGTVLTMAGHKGYALALLVEVLSSVMSGAAIGPAVGSMYKNLDRKQDVGHFFALLDIAAFMDVVEFNAADGWDDRQDQIGPKAAWRGRDFGAGRAVGACLQRERIAWREIGCGHVERAARIVRAVWFGISRAAGRRTSEGGG